MNPDDILPHIRTLTAAHPIEINLWQKAPTQFSLCLSNQDKAARVEFQCDDIDTLRQKITEEVNAFKS